MLRDFRNEREIREIFEPESNKIEIMWPPRIPRIWIKFCFLGFISLKISSVGLKIFVLVFVTLVDCSFHYFYFNILRPNETDLKIQDLDRFYMDMVGAYFPLFVCGLSYVIDRNFSVEKM